ncbi:hypothetical protein PENTCL1PPCAC_20237 [Pristionchus entomophagus]|uniref:Uncharacterized protein n=1 Tax=Pristionchus entomophagus TaxID=358040 RepID=A0AAV5TUZ9_9BILA|nr:hypothetical protein PENTCL1PPCAC_20237 [Pristionchus entomophagus]
MRGVYIRTARRIISAHKKFKKRLTLMSKITKVFNKHDRLEWRTKRAVISQPQLLLRQRFADVAKLYKDFATGSMPEAVREIVQREMVAEGERQRSDG